MKNFLYFFEERTDCLQNSLLTFDGETLLTSPLQPVRFVVDDFLSDGVHVLAGAPKVGKSWLALWLCMKVATGEPLWNFPTRGGEVLYLCLEDSANRIQTRLLELCDLSSEQCLSRLHFSTQAGQIGTGLEAQLETFEAQHPDTKLIVIDTLQKVRGFSNDNAYASDYRDLSILKALADKLQIAILLIHHLRKQSDNDPLNRISGTTGVSGAVDSTFVLEEESRGSKKAKLTCTGRDIEHRELELEFDRENHIWNLTANSLRDPEHFLDPTISLLCAYIKQTGYFCGTATELAEKINLADVHPSALAKKIVRHRDKLLTQDIWFESARTPQRREIILRYDGNDAYDGNSGVCIVSENVSQASLVS